MSPFDTPDGFHARSATFKTAILDRAWREACFLASQQSPASVTAPLPFVDGFTVWQQSQLDKAIGPPAA
jgi:hypothetical protein